MSESKILSNIPFTIHNYGNYSIVEEETRDIVDVPYFPAQNLVDVSGDIKPYAPAVDFYVPFYDSNNEHRLYGLLNRTDARCVFVEYADNARYIHYKFTGNSYPQGRSNYSYTYNGTDVFLFGGYSNGRCMNDLWKYNVDTNAWTNLNINYIEPGANEAPTRRRKSATLISGDDLWLFGGETDTLTVSTSEGSEFIVPLNDIWSFDTTTKTWTNYDLNRAMPHRTGHFVYADPTLVRILVLGGINEIGISEPTAIYTLDRVTDTVTSTSFTSPFTISSANITLVIGSVVHVLTTSGDLYQWDNTNTQFILLLSGIAGINPLDGYYWKTSDVNVDYGANSAMGSANVTNAELYNDSDVLQATNTMALPPRGTHIPSINVGNSQTFFYGGLYLSGSVGQFNESTYLMNHTTLHVTKHDFDSDARPTERSYPALAYDSYRGRVWLFGGFDGTKFYNDLWYFDLALKSWTQVHAQLESTENTDYPAPRQKAGMAVVDTDYLYIIGGYSDSDNFSDFWQYRINIDTWTKVYATDTIPWGSQYFIFEWRDRLWMYNGQQLYRWYETVKQFVAQPFLIGSASTYNADRASTDDLTKLIASKSYLESPINTVVVDDYMIVQNDDFLFRVELESKIVMDWRTQFGLTDASIWLDSYLGIGVSTLSNYYINISPLIPLTKNQQPSSTFYNKVNDPLPDGCIYTDNLTVPGSPKIKYQDNSGLFNIKPETIPLNKGTLSEDGVVSFVGKQSEFTSFDFNDVGAMATKTQEILDDPTSYPYTPWFEYHKYKPSSSVFTGVQKVLYNESTSRVYLVYKNGNIMRVNPADNTFFTYYTDIWEGSAVGYDKSKNKIYAFGGMANTRTVYEQNGLEYVRSEGEASHKGMMEFDLGINQMNLGSISTYLQDRGVTSVDYSTTKTYLASLISRYVESYSSHTVPNSIEDVQDKLYLATQPLIDDLSQFDFAFEAGTRPTGRAYSASVQIDNKLYVFSGCQNYRVSCYGFLSPAPYYTKQPGFWENSKAGSELYNLDLEARTSYYFDMDFKQWNPIEQLPEWRYLSSAIASPDNRFIYIVGGFTGADCSGISNDILIYDTQSNSYEKIKGIPTSFKGRAKPVLHWIDEERLLIQHGYYTYKTPRQSSDCSGQIYSHAPLGDSWIYDKKSNLLYRAFADQNKSSGLIVRENYYSNEARENSAYVFSIVPEVDIQGQAILNMHKWNLVNGEIEAFPVKASNDIVNEYNGFNYRTSDSKISLMQSLAESGVSENYLMETLLTNVISQSNFRFRHVWMQEYGANDHQHLFIIGEKSDSFGSAAIDEMAAGESEAHLRFWKVDMEQPYATRILENIPYEYPLPYSPVLVAYDGSRYIYCIYNKYNIWRLDFMNVLNDPSGSWWYQCPPCLDCNFLGSTRTNGSGDDPWEAFFTKPKYLTLLSAKGRMARMDTDSFAWFLDKEIAPITPTPRAPVAGTLLSSAEPENDEVYLFELGGISGKVLNIYEKQWDNYFFDMTQTSKVTGDYGSFISNKMAPVVFRRRRMYTMNELGHMHYAWLRIDGEYDVEFQLGDFYQCTEARIYGDNNLLDDITNLVVQVFDINDGWSTISNTHISTIEGQTGWDWEGDFSRQYIRSTTDGYGNVVSQTSKLPPNYISVDLATALADYPPLSKIRVFYKNAESSSNYISRINKVDLISDQEVVASYESAGATSPLSIISIDPLTTGETYSNEFAVYVKNESSDTVQTVVAYGWDNNWLEFNADPVGTPDAWVMSTQNTPFAVADEIGPGSNTYFYVRAVNIDSRPHAQDLVVRGIFPYDGTSI